ncbi:MAG TPA: hypothetical protein VL859_03115, partial [Flavobacterium sp.]|nr:hypothetical protein [Flavobacterium sp.]
MKQKYLFTLFLFFSFFSTYSQADGDFQSKATGNWESASSWEIYNSTTLSWESTLNYPGQANGNYAVTINSGNTITVSTNLVTTSMGDLTVNGTLDLQGGSNPKQISLNTPTLHISSTGVLNFSNQKTQLYLPNNAVIKVDSGGNISGACSNNTEIYIDNKLIAVCNGSGNSNVLTFGEIVAGSGTLNANIINPIDFSSTVCNGTNIALSGGYTGTPSGAVTYLWTVKDPNNNTVSISNSTSTTTSFTPTMTGLYSISFIVTDGTAFSNTETKTVTVGDTTPPVTPTLTDINVGECSGTPTAPTTTDNCAGTITGTPNVSFPISTQGTTIVTWTFNDGNGNTATAQQNVIVDDITKPSLTAVSNRNENLDTSCNFIIPNYTILTTASDNCTAVGNIIKTQSPAIGTEINGHNTTQLITITANDGNGNTQTISFTITLKDITLPTASNPTTINVQCLSAVPAPNVLVVTDEADNCGTPTVTFVSQTANPLVNDGTIIRTYRVDDGNGNTIDITQNIVIDDNTLPTASNPATINVQCLSDVPAPNVLVVTD